MGKEHDTKGHKKESMGNVEKGDYRFPQRKVDHLGFADRQIQQGLYIGHGHFLKHVPEHKVKGQIVDHKLVDHSQGVPNFHILDDEKGSDAHSQEDNDKIQRP